MLVAFSEKQKEFVQELMAELDISYGETIALAHHVLKHIVDEGNGIYVIVDKDGDIHKTDLRKVAKEQL